MSQKFRIPKSFQYRETFLHFLHSSSDLNDRAKHDEQSKNTMKRKRCGKRFGSVQGCQGYENFALKSADVEKS